MNRNNIWIHIGIAVILIALAAVLGQIRRWQNGFVETKVETTTETKSIKRAAAQGVPEVLVKFRPGVSRLEIRRLAERHNDKVEDEIEIVSGLFSIDDLDNADAETVARQYSDMTDLVIYAEANYEIRLDPQIETTASRDLLYRVPAADQPNDPRFADQWSLNNLGQNGGKARADIAALKAWLQTHGSKEVVVAVLDSGVDYTHADLVSNMWFRPDNIPAYSDDQLGPFNDERGYNAVKDLGDPMDDNGHGTHCAGIIGAEGDNGEGIAGINWNVRIMPLKFMGRGGFGSTKDAIEAINYAVDRKKKGVSVRVINASWGSTMHSKALEDAIRAAGEEGILFVAAAGNNGADNDRRPHYPSSYNLPNVISVAALDHSDELASFSNYGVKSVHVAAPGKDILSTWLGGDYREASGTSMATPHVAGVAALIIADDPKITMKKLRERLLGTADELASLKGRIETGSRICAENALGNIVKQHSHQ